ARMPDAGFVNAGEPSRVFALVDPVLQFAHPERAALCGESKALVVAALRIARAIVSRGRAAPEPGPDREFLRRLDDDANTGSRDGTNGSALNLVGGEIGRVAEGGVDQPTGRVADEEFIVGGQLADAHVD